ncbi:inhibitor of nuclear factor kappa-B kinase subunit beta [Toxorhynchites rutilus septentrionalis]|uniref:inhibitor of nuclear factor kappa-B kinase subunit beta n=1 Tax=Toxorhynchites rutilus septentrionalis TaxID=329112 RepID=UPI00247B2781|nr:inhibitor of nuclear factor kappa-B kinase subunit beta [Toxorhynchites rutilus septentrionalis]
MLPPEEDPPIIGDWHREKRLGSGGFGVVTLWKNQKTKEVVAIKKFHILQDRSEMTDKYCERWRNEVNLMTNTAHNKNIVRTVQIKPEGFLSELMKNSASKLPILCMEYCEGGDLRRVLNRASNCSGLREPEIREILRSLRNAISYLHSLKITHRDVKPENIVLKVEEGKEVYKLTDLGYAKALDKQSLNASLVGTVEYIAPDLICCDRYSCSVDYWSMGIIGFEIICGVRPFIPHAQLAKWMTYVQQKKSTHIAITEDNRDNYTYHNELFPENYISSCLKKYLESWLMLALEWNPKQRGYASQIGTNEVTEQQLKSVKFADASGQPVQVLKVFSMLDAILDRKILTIFCLYTCRFISVAIDDSSDFEIVRSAIQTNTGIVPDEMQYILPIEQKLDGITDSTKPIDLFITDFYEKPMLFVARKGFIIRSDLKPEIPKSVSDIFQNIKVKLKPHALRQFAGNAYHFITNEQRLYVTALDGIKNYGLVLNEEIVKYKDEVGRMNKITYGVMGGLEYHKLTLTYTKEKMRGKQIPVNIIDQSFTLWEERCGRMESNVLKLLEVADKITRRYESVLKRSRDAVYHQLLKDYDQQDYFNLKALASRFEIVRVQILEKSTHEKSHIDLLQAVYECLKKRDVLLRDYSFKELQQQLVDIRSEMQEIRKTMGMALEHGEKFKKELAKMTLEHNDNIWNLMQNLVKSNQPVIPDIERIMDVMSLGSPILNDGELPNCPKFHVGGSVTTLQDSLGEKSISKSLLCFGEGPDVDSLITANDSLIMTTEDLIHDGFDLTK